MTSGRELLSLHVGQAGNQIALPFWSQLLEEHGIEKDGNASPHAVDEQRARAGVYFAETGSGRYIPRSVQIDLEPGVIQAMKSSDIGAVFKPDSFFNGLSSAGNNWAKGFYTEGADHIDSILERIRSDVEACDVLQGFQLVHSLGGGTGSGLGALLLSKLREEYPDRIQSTYSVLPSPEISDTVVEPYNTILTVNQLIELSDATYTIDNAALYDIREKVQKESNPSVMSVNKLIAQAMSGATTSLRFPGQLNADLRKLATNMVPFPRLHFFSVALAPLTSDAGAKYRSSNVSEIVQQLFSPGNTMAACDPRLGVYLTSACMFRGRNIQAYDVETAIANIRHNNASFFAPWVPNSTMTSLCDVPPPGETSGATLVGNNTAIGELFKRSHSQFSALARRRAYYFWYCGEGMDEQDFTEAESNVLDLIAEYQQYASAELDEEELLDEEEDVYEQESAEYE